MTDPCDLHAQESQRLQPDRTPETASTPDEGTSEAGCILTDAEREAIELAWCSVGRDDAFHQRDEQRIRDTLLVLLERTR
jgi:hypothetical protein